MTSRYVVITVTTLILVALAYFGGKISQEQQTLRLKRSEVQAVSRNADQLKLIYPKNEGGERPAATPVKSIRTHSGLTSNSAIERLSRKLKGVEITPEQMAQMQDVYNVVFEGRQKFEVSNARVGKTASGTVIEIPSYAAFGGQLRSTMASAFESILGKDKASLVDTQIGAQIDVENTYWGKYPQIIQADYDSEKKHFRITRVINPTPENPDAFKQEFDSTLSSENLDVYGVYRDWLLPAN